MIFGALRTVKFVSKVSTVLWVAKTAHNVYKGYQKTAPAVKATNKVLKSIKKIGKVVGK